MHLIDADRPLLCVALFLQKLAVRPRKVRQLGHHGGRAVRFGAHRIGIRAQHLPAVGGNDGILVELSLPGKSQMRFPHARGADHVHGVGLRVPFVEIADDADRARFRRPDGKAVDPLALQPRARMAAQRAICGSGYPFIEKIQFRVVKMIRHSVPLLYSYCDYTIGPQENTSLMARFRGNCGPADPEKPAFARCCPPGMCAGRRICGRAHGFCPASGQKKPVAGGRASPASML